MTALMCTKFVPCDCDSCEFAKTHKDGIWAGTVKCVDCREDKDKHTLEACTGASPGIAPLGEPKPLSQLPVIYRALKKSGIPEEHAETLKIMTEAGYHPMETPCTGCTELVLVDGPTFIDATRRATLISEKPMMVYCHVCVNEMYTPTEIKGTA